MCWQICQHPRVRRVSWIKAARKNFEAFPPRVQERMLFVLEIAASGQMADIAKPMKGLDGGVFEIALPYRGDAYRAVYAVRIGADI
jgi:phage-related protein